MIALDTNFIIALLVNTDANHSSVYQWFQDQKEPLAIPSICLGETLRLMTHPRVFAKPLKLSGAIKLLSSFIGDFDVTLLTESDDWLNELDKLGKAIPGIKGNEIFDAKIALCLQFHGIKHIATFDRDFLKFGFLKIVKVD